MNAESDGASMRDAWFLHEGEVYLATAARAPAGYTRVDGEEAALVLRLAAARSPFELRRAFPAGRLHSEALAPTSIPEDPADEVRLYRMRRLALVPIEPQVEDLSDLAPPVEPPPTEPVKHWIEVRMSDRAGAPLANAPCRIERPDGAIVEGRTDSQGALRLTDITTMGPCRVSFPDLQTYILDTYAKA